MSAAVSRHGRPHAGFIDRPRGYPVEYIPDLPQFPATGNEWDTLHPQPLPPKNAWLPGKLALVVCWLGVICLVVPAYL